MIMYLRKNIQVMLLLSMAMPFAASAAGDQKQSHDHLKKSTSLQHHELQAAKHMCLHLVHTSKHKLTDYDAARLVWQCSKGEFAHVIQALGANIEKDQQSFTDEDGEQLLAEWEIIARKGQQHLDILENAKESKK